MIATKLSKANNKIIVMNIDYRRSKTSKKRRNLFF
jgi:hypothetical protein